MSRQLNWAFSLFIVASGVTGCDTGLDEPDRLQFGPLDRFAVDTSPLYQRLVPFQIFDRRDLIFEGTLEQRVDRDANDGTMTFTYRVLETTSDLTGSLTRIETSRFLGVTVDPEFDLNGPGGVVPAAADQSFNGSVVSIHFAPSMLPGEESVAIRMRTDAKYVMSGGSTMLFGPNGTSITVDTLMPAVDKIAFHSDRDGIYDVYVMNGDGSGVRKLTRDIGGGMTPAISPDGLKVAFTSGVAGNNDVWVINVDRTGLKQLTDDPATDINPAWSPDGTKIAFESSRDGAKEIFVMNADGTNEINLTKHPAFDRNPAWSPDGSKIVFQTGRDGDGDDGNEEIYVMNADGSNPINLTKHPGNDTDPSYSPDGSMIVYGSARNSGPVEIYVMNADGSDPENLTKNPSSSDSSPVFNVDGTKIAFHSFRDGEAEIYVMNVDGSEQTNLTIHEASDALPSFGFGKMTDPFRPEAPDFDVLATD